MANLATEDDPLLKVSDIEFKLPQPSYTVNTLVYLNEKYPDYQFTLIMGEDNLRSLHKWKNFETILEGHDILVYPRVLTESEMQNPPERSPLLDRENIHMVEGPLMKISASYIRNALKEGKDVRYLLTEKVWTYCEEMRFYK